MNANELKKIMKINLDFTNVNDNLPEKSGDYLCYVRFDNDPMFLGIKHDGYFGLMNYSTRYKLFNVVDYAIDTNTAITGVVMWAEIDPIIQKLESKVCIQCDGKEKEKEKDER